MKWAVGEVLGVSRQEWGRFCEFSSEESGKSVEVEARSRGESKRPVVE